MRLPCDFSKKVVRSKVVLISVIYQGNKWLCDVSSCLCRLWWALFPNSSSTIKDKMLFVRCFSSMVADAASVHTAYSPNKDLRITYEGKTWWFLPFSYPSANSSFILVCMQHVGITSFEKGCRVLQPKGLLWISRNIEIFFSWILWIFYLDIFFEENTYWESLLKLSYCGSMGPNTRVDMLNYFLAHFLLIRKLFCTSSFSRKNALTNKSGFYKRKLWK